MGKKAQTKAEKLAKKEYMREYRLKVKNGHVPRDTVYKVKKTYHVHFLCAHQGTFVEPVPRPDDILWCYRCDGWQAVVKVDQRFAGHAR
jgi:hypothetical protein